MWSYVYHKWRRNENKTQQQSHFGSGVWAAGALSWNHQPYMNAYDDICVEIETNSIAFFLFTHSLTLSLFFLAMILKSCL